MIRYGSLLKLYQKITYCYISKWMRRESNSRLTQRSSTMNHKLPAVFSPAAVITCDVNFATQLPPTPQRRRIFVSS